MRYNGIDRQIARKIVAEIDEINEFISGVTQEQFACDRLLQKGVTMSLINIGELSKLFTPAFTEHNKHIPLKQIIGLRNIAAHRYEVLDMDDIWDTVKSSTPRLRVILTTFLEQPSL